MSTQSSIVSFADGDIVLHSTDDLEFRVDSVVLRRCSNFFDDLTTLPFPPEALTSSNNVDSPERLRELRMTEDSATLNAILRAIYSLTPIPKLESLEEGIKFMTAVDKLQMSNYTIDRVVELFLSTLHPLRAWALAVRFKRNDERKNACRRVITSGLGIFSSAEGMPELDVISARAVARLQRIAEQAVGSAKALAGKTHWVSKGPLCWAHGGISDFTKMQLEEWQEDPWKGEQYTSNVLAGMRRNQVCEACHRGFISYQKDALPRIGKILDGAVQEEVQGAEPS
ncbi:hypothetical protein DL93DRAFT_290145 [Clavulina sp. PMI_390]|nr:hypothetical protein DL93DRAFT_290145 [Clavulina sp. PMI_390]